MSRTRSALYLAVSAFVAAACSNEATSTTLPKVVTTPSFTTGNPVNTGSKEAYTLAVFGDFPYGPAKLADAPGLFALINSDPKVDIVVHLGDIKAGSSSPCTTAYFDTIRTLFATFRDPLVYTPGDNEWVDCHVANKNNGLFTPTERLQTVRSMFFPVAGLTIGGRKKQVLTEADDPANSAFIENVMWQESQIVFATLNLQGSNDDLAPWGTPLPADGGNYPSQADERKARVQANQAWLRRLSISRRRPTRPVSCSCSRPTCGTRRRRSPDSTTSSSRSAISRSDTASRCSFSRAIRTCSASISRSRRPRRSSVCTLGRPSRLT